MRKLPFALPLFALLAPCAALLAQTPVTPALVHDRIPALTASSPRIALMETVAGRALHARDLGAAPADTPLTALTLRFSLTQAQTAALSALEAAQQNPSSPAYHQWLTPEQYAAEFGLSTDDLGTVTAWLGAQGFSSIAVARSRSFVSFSGTAGQVAQAFGTTLHTLSADGEQHVANLTNPTLPAGLAGVVTGMTGLNDFHLKPHVQVHSSPAPQFTSSISGNHFIAPGDFYTIYDINPLLNASVNGSGITIAVMGQTDILLTDDAAFRSASGLPANAPTVSLYGTDPGVSANDLPEASLDVEWSGAVAPSASILYVNSTDVIAGSLTQAIDNNVAPILTISYGDCETGFGSSSIATYNQLFRQATVQGQTILGPAGDSGATDCDYQVTTATSGLAVDFPASSPYVTGVGGSMFNENGGTYFNATNGAFQGSAISYIPEAVWNESASGGGLASGGGGFSSFFTKPAYQVGAGVPNDFSRDVPDISFDAAASHDGYLFCSGGFCSNGFRNAAGNLDVVGGTSVSTPAFAGIMALLEQSIKTRVGNANPTIYGLANSTYYTSVFHDITVGNNASPCTAGSPNCPNGGSIGYPATAGYDLASGWGSVDVNNMIADWLLVTPAGITSTTGNNFSMVTVSESRSMVNTGTPVTLSATVASATTGVTATPSGTAQLLVDGVPIGTPMALAAGAASFTVDTTGFSSGNHVLTAVYSGDATYQGSKSSVNLDAVSSTTADFSLTPSLANLTAKSGATSPGITYTVTPSNGFTGSVQFTASTTSNALGSTANVSFSVNPVVVSSAAGGSTVFTLQAYLSQAHTGVGLERAPAGGGAENHSPMPPWQAGTGLAMAAGFCFLVFARPRRRWNALSLALFAALSLGLFAAAGCGNTSTVPSTAVPVITKTPPGTYTVIVTATATISPTVSITHNAAVTVVVQ